MKAYYIEDLREIRKFLKITQTDLSNIMGKYNKAVICDYESGRKIPSVATFADLVDGLGYELALVPKGYRDFARTVCEEKAKLDSNADNSNESDTNK